MGPVIRRIYDQMPEPKWVIAMGACASTGGPFDSDGTVRRQRTFEDDEELHPLADADRSAVHHVRDLRVAHAPAADLLSAPASPQ